MVTQEFVRLAKVASLSAGATLLVVNELGYAAKVEGNSMQPTFNPFCGHKNEDFRSLVNSGNMTRQELTRELKTRLQQDRVMLSKFSPRDKRNLNVGDVVILISPYNPTKTLIKRITAMPGDTIYLTETNETKVIDQGHCWVEGDNSQSSLDSNIFGQVPLGLIEGRVCFVVWPLHRIGKVISDHTLSSYKTILLSQASK